MQDLYSSNMNDRGFLVIAIHGIEKTDYLKHFQYNIHPVNFLDCGISIRFD